MGKESYNIFLPEEKIAKRVAELGAEISRDYAGKDLLLVGVLKGSVLFLADLMRHISIPVSIDFIAVSSYGAGTVSSGEVKILKDFDKPIENKHVLIVEDILDSGKTLRYIIDLLGTRAPASLQLCVLLDKPERRQAEVCCQYTGFTVPDEFLVGYGLDYNEKYRNLPYIAQLRLEP